MKRSKRKNIKLMNSCIMGNIQKNTQCSSKSTDLLVSQFKFHEPFEEEDTTNGLCFNSIYLPEELVIEILSYITAKDLLWLTLVCRKWCNIIKSENLWRNIYNRHTYSNKAKKLPWYVYYCYLATNNFDNLLKNGNGQEEFKHWKIINNGGDGFRIENPPAGAEPLCLDVPEFNGKTSCFATSFRLCRKIQVISLKDKRLLRYILNKFMPHIYVSEWVTGRYDCGCMYKLNVRGYNEEHYSESIDFGTGIDSLGTNSIVVQQWEGREWEKVEILVKKYPPEMTLLIFDHEGRDTQFWKGHYGSKMAGGVVRILFDSIQPLDD